MNWVVGLMLMTAEYGHPPVEATKRLECLPGFEYILAAHGYVAGFVETRSGDAAIIC